MGVRHLRTRSRRLAQGRVPRDALDEEEVPASPSSADPSDGLDHRERSERVHAALESLPESQRVVVHLHRFDGLGFAERLEPRPSGSVILNVEAHWRAGIEAEVVVAAVEDRATTKVTRGENAGRTLTHVAIVRSMSVVGTGAGTFSGPTVIDPVEWRRANRVVAFVQERRGGPVHPVDSVTLPVMVAPTRLQTSR